MIGGVNCNEVVCLIHRVRVIKHNINVMLSKVFHVFVSCDDVVFLEIPELWKCYS